MSEYFIRWITADNAIHNLKSKIADIETEIKKYESEAADARNAIEQEFAENGVVEDIIHGELIDYKIYFTAGRESVKVENPDSVPDEFCKIERKPKLREIKEHIESGNLVNWATIETGSGKLTYKAKERK